MSRRRRQADRHPGLKRSTPASRAAHVLLPAMFRAATGAARGWRKSEAPEFLHRLRVAARRYRAAVRFFKPLLERDSVRRVLKATDRLATVTGPVRDADVLAGLGQNVRRGAAGVTPGRARLREFLAGREFRALREEVTRLHLSGRAAQSHRRAPALGTFAVERMQCRLDELMNCDLPGHLDKPNRIHVIRKRVRRLRYWTEMLARTCGAQMSRLAARLHGVATALGELHDVDMATERRQSDSRSLRRLRRDRVRRARSAWRTLTNREGHRLIRMTMASAGGKETR